MLTAKQNLDEVIKGGHPDRFSNQYEAVYLMFHPAMTQSPLLKPGDMHVKNAWGITNSFPVGTPGAFPEHTPELTVLKDIEHWQDYVHAPTTEFPDELWGVFQDQYAQVDGTKAYKATFVAPGLFEQCHHLGDMAPILMNLYEYPDEMHDLIDYLKEYELRLAEGICSHLHPDAIFHHDDMGSQKSTFMSPAMWEEFFVEPYKEIYGYYHDHGVKLVFHHSDSYAATLVPAMIEMGIDVWQGCFSTNDMPALIKKYGGQISFMGGIENKLVDFDGWSDENNREVIRKTLDECGNKYFIPCIAQGGPGSVYPGVYASMCKEIDQYSIEKFGVKQEDLDAQRLPWQILF